MPGYEIAGSKQLLVINYFTGVKYCGFWETPGELFFERDAAIASHHGFLAIPGSAVDRLPCAGLSDVPVWFRPFGYCSNGQQARACSGLAWEDPLGLERGKL